jgi:hypothetical protein
MNFGNLKFWDISLVKLAVLSATLFLVSIWSGFANWAINTHWAWFLAATIIFSIEPMIKVFK